MTPAVTTTVTDGHHSFAARVTRMLIVAADWSIVSVIRNTNRRMADGEFASMLRCVVKIDCLSFHSWSRFPITPNPSTNWNVKTSVRPVPLVESFSSFSFKMGQSLFCRLAADLGNGAKNNTHCCWQPPWKTRKRRCRLVANLFLIALQTSFFPSLPWHLCEYF